MPSSATCSPIACAPTTLASRDSLRILDAGCGPGGNGAWLAEHGAVVGVDLSPDALAFVRERRPGTRPVRGSVTALPLASDTFDVAIAVTVLYAVDDDVTAVHELARVLRPGGAVVLVEPAFDAFRRGHDDVVHGKRRYRRGRLRALVEAAGLQTERATYAYSFLAPPAAALGALDRVRRPGAGAVDTAPDESDVDRRGLDQVFAPLAAQERRWLRRHDIAVGTSLLLLATKPS
ncbi:MAG: class I SAM-dependent methyltransferase [Acidimicrobiia bacterium]